MVSDVPNLIVASQYPVWFVPQDDDDGVEDDDKEYEDDGCGGDPEEVLMARGESRPEGGAVLEDDQTGEELAEVSFALTMLEKDARGVVVDFSIINLCGVPLNQPRSKIRYGG